MPIVPDSIDRAALVAALQSMGISTDDLLTASLRPRSIELEYTARNEAGEPVVVGNEFGTIRVAVPIAKAVS